MQKEDLTAIEIKSYPVAVKADLGGGLAKIVIGVVAFVTSAIKIVKELIVFIRYKASKLEVFRVTVAGKVKKSVKVVGQ
jgi:hypothetical protein